MHQSLSSSGFKLQFSKLFSFGQKSSNEQKKVVLWYKLISKADITRSTSISEATGSWPIKLLV